jgi:hypothetical protein
MVSSLTETIFTTDFPIPLYDAIKRGQKVSVQITGRRGVVSPTPDDTIIQDYTDNKGVTIRIDAVDNPNFWMELRVTKWQLETWLKQIEIAGASNGPT